MRKFVCIALILMILSPVCLAEGGAKLGEDVYLAVGEGAGAALIYIRGGEGGARATIADRAEAIETPVTRGDMMYYLRKSEGEWYLASRDAGGYSSIEYKFPEGATPSALSEADGYLYLLLDGKLHVMYPETNNCFKLAGVSMESYAVAGDFTYFSSMSDKIGYTSKEGAAREAGCLYRLNNNTGVRTLLIKNGVSDIKLRGGTLYFHNYADNYSAYGENGAVLGGRLYSYDIESGETAALGGDYDWDFFPTDAGVMLRREGGLYANGALVAEMSGTADAIEAGGEVYIIEYENFTVSAVSASGEMRTVYSEK